MTAVLLEIASTLAGVVAVIVLRLHGALLRWIDSRFPVNERVKKQFRPPPTVNELLRVCVWILSVSILFGLCGLLAHLVLVDGFAAARYIIVAASLAALTEYAFRRRFRHEQRVSHK